jgi:hypothetical protein
MVLKQCLLIFLAFFSNISASIARAIMLVDLDELIFANFNVELLRNPTPSFKGKYYLSSHRFAKLILKFQKNQKWTYRCGGKSTLLQYFIARANWLRIEPLSFSKCWILLSKNYCVCRQHCFRLWLQTRRRIFFCLLNCLWSLNSHEALL